MSLNNYDSLYDVFRFFDAAFSYPSDVSLKYTYPTASFPPVDVFMNDNTKDLTFKLAIAGYDKKDVEISFSGDIMEVRSEKKEEKNNEKILKKGIRESSFRVKYTVPSSKYEQDKANASFKDGILTIHIPAKTKEARKLLEIK